MDLAGAETMLMNIYRAIDRSEVQFDFLVNEQRECAYDAEIQSLGGKLYRIPRFTGINLHSYLPACDKAMRMLSSTHPIVHGHIGMPAAIYLSAAKRYGCTTVAHSHGENGPISPLELGFRFFSYPTRYVADYLFACSKQAGIDRFGKRATEAGKVRIISNGIDTERFSFSEPRRSLTRSALSLDGYHVIGHVGRFDPAKNHKFLIPVFAEVARRDPLAHLVLVGSGPLKQTVQDIVKDHGLLNRVTFLENRTDIPDLLSSFDCFLFPSLHEGVPVALLEAQASGLPCFVSDAIRDEAISTLLATRLALADGPSTWAETIVNVLSQTHNRTIGPAIVCEMGYDIRQSALQLQEFYLNSVQS